MPTLTEIVQTISTDLDAAELKLSGIEDNAKDDQSSNEVPFNNAGTDMAATDVEAAIKELDTRVDTAESTLGQGAAGTSYDNSSSGLSATNTQAAIDEVEARVDASDTKLAGIEVNAKDDQNASEVPYDNASSGMLATDLQGAVDEVEGRVVTAEAKLGGIEANAKDDQSAAEVPYDNTTSGMTATDTQAAIDEMDTRVTNAETSVTDIEASIDSSTWVLRQPKALYPVDGAVDIPATFELDATAYANAFGTLRDYREFEIDLATGDFTTPVYSFQGNTDSHSIVVPLYTENTYKWRCRDVSTVGEVSPWMTTATFDTVLTYVEMPTLTVEGDPSSVPENPTLTTSAFAVANGTDTHASTTWTIKRASDNVTVWEEVNDTVNLVSITVPTGILLEDTGYIFKVQHVGTTEGASGFRTEVATTLVNFPTVDLPSLTVSGAPASVTEEPTLTSSAFSVSNGSDTHLHTNWRIEKVFDDSLVWESLNNTTDLLTIDVPPGNLLESVNYRFMVQHVGTAYGESLWASVDATTQANFAAVVTPIITVTGSPSSVPEEPTITTSGFATYTGSDTHATTSWRVVRTSDDVVVWSSVNDAVNKTFIDVPAGILTEGVEYSFEAQHNGTTFGSSDYGVLVATTLNDFTFINAPTLTVEGSPTSTPEAPTLTTNAFSVNGGSDTHASTDWEVRTMADALVWQDLASTSLLSVGVPAGLLSVSTQYKFRVRHNGTTNGASAWTEVTSTTLAEFSIPIDELFSAYAYEGNETARSIQNNIDLATEGGLIWIKSRESAQGHNLTDTVRGTDENLNTASTSGNNNNTQRVTSFNSDGFDLGTNVTTNPNAESTISWTFRKAPKFFDVVTYTGDGVAGRQIAHNLGIAPGMVIVKRYDAGTTSQKWNVYHRSEGATKFGALNTTSAFSASSTAWNDTEPTDTVFTLGNDQEVNAVGSTYIAYLFAHDTDPNTGVIQCGSYTGNGSADGPEIDLGWEPQYVLIKCASFADIWIVQDNIRGIVSGGTGKYLQPHSNSAEITYDIMDLNSKGFKITTTASRANAISQEYIYMAIRRPMKEPTSGTGVFAVDTRIGTSSADTIPSNGFPVDLAVYQSLSGYLGNGGSVASRLTGDNLQLYTYNTNAAGSATNQVTDFDLMDGIGIGDATAINASGQSYINYLFKRAPGFMDVVCYEGDGVDGRVVNHSLTGTPELSIIKNLSGTYSWSVYHESFGAYTSNASKNLELDSNSALSNGGTFKTDGFSTTQFTVSSAGEVNLNTNDYIAILFATLPGISKVGSYTGNGANQDIDCGFVAGARFVMVKRTDSTGDWFMWDTVRGIVTGNDPHLSLNTTAAQATGDDSIDPLAAGFTVNQNATTDINTSGGQYIYLAIA